MASMRGVNHDSAEHELSKLVVQNTYILGPIWSSLLRLSSSWRIHIVSVAPCHMQRTILVDVEAVDVSACQLAVAVEGLTRYFELP